MPIDVDQWEWGCGFYLGTDPGEGNSGTRATLEAARTEFEAAWRTFLLTRTQADFQAWRDKRLDRVELHHTGCWLEDADPKP